MPKIAPIQSNIQIKVLSDHQLREIKTATLDLLADVGVNFPSRQALDVFASHGAQVDFHAHIVKMEPQFVVEAMRHAPRTYTLAGRTPMTELHLDGENTYFATDGCGTMTLDFETGEMRPSCKQDVADMARISDALPSVSFYWPMVSAQDYGPLAPLHELDASLNNTSKHIQLATFTDPHLAQTCIQVAEILAGGTHEMRRAAPLSNLICTLAPLGQDKDAIEAAMLYAQAGLPVGFMSMPTLGSTAPATMGGALALANAEVISAMVLMQLVAPGASVYHSILASVIDPHTAGYLTSIPEKYLCNLAAVQLAHDWGVPSLAGAYGLDYADPDAWELGRDAVYTSLMVPMVSADMVVAFGLLRASTLLVPEQILLDDETYHLHRRIAAGIQITPDTLALDTIAAVGPRGHFLSQKHTRKHLHDIWIPPLAHPRPWQVEGGDGDIRQRARQRFRTLLAEYHPSPLDENMRAEIEKIFTLAARDFKT